MKISEIRKHLTNYRGSTKLSERTGHRLPDGFIKGKVTTEGMVEVTNSMHARLLHNEYVSAGKRVGSRMKIMNSGELKKD